MKKYQIFSLTFLALPLSFVGIPIYLNIADFYARKFDLNLAIIGILLIVVRIFDAAQDPLIGQISDRLANKKIQRRKIVLSAATLLCCGFYLVFNPPEKLSELHASLWFFFSLFLTYLAFNFVVINFESLIAIKAQNEKERITLNTTKELFGLIGMIMAFAIPGLITSLAPNYSDQNYLILSAIFISLVLLGSFLFESQSPSLSCSSSKSNPQFYKIFKDQKFVKILPIFALNAVAVALPAANMNFFVRDVLQAEKTIPWFLSSYFLSACIFTAFWKKLFERIGVLKAWKISIAGSVMVFIFACFLGQESANYFYLICICSGIFLSADLIAVSTILSRIVKENQSLASSYFSLWNMVSKISLMIAASGSLIVLGFFDYHPGKFTTQNLSVITFFYAALPCLLKMYVISLLRKLPAQFFLYEN